MPKASDLLKIAAATLVIAAALLSAYQPETLAQVSPVSPVRPEPTPEPTPLPIGCVSKIAAEHHQNGYNMVKYYVAPEQRGLPVCAETLPDPSVPMYHETWTTIHLFFTGGAQWLVHKWFDSEQPSLVTPEPTPLPTSTPQPVQSDQLDWLIEGEVYWLNETTPCDQYTDGTRVTRLVCPSQQ